MNKEDLNNKYIRYSSDITEEIFNKIIKKAESLGFIAYGIDCNYEGFTRHGYLRFSSAGHYQTAGLIIDGSLITINYILKEEPKEWYENLKKGDYFVVTKSCKGYNGELNHIYKAEKDGYFYSGENFRIHYESGNGSTIGLAYINIRPATPEEIEMYKEAGKPVDVTTYKLPNKTNAINFEVGDIVRFNVEKAKALNPVLVTSVWAKDFILEIHNINEENLVFTGESMLKAGAVNPALTCSNDKRCFDLVEKKLQKSEFIHVNNLEINKIYKCSYKNDGKYQFWKYLGKGSAKSEKYYWIKTTPYLKPDEKYLAPSGGYSNKYYTDYIKEATTEESAWYEECLKEKKYISFEEFKKMEKEFKLPEKWCIVKNKKEICDWFNKSEGRTSTFNLSSRNNCYIHFPPINGANLHNNIQDGYTEITFEQFKKYVLKESIEEGIRDLSKYIGRYIKALVDNPNGGDVKAGDIGLIINEGQVDFPLHKGYYCTTALYYPDRYELMPEDYKPESSFKEYFGYKIGDKVIINKKPSMWASLLCSKDIRNEISYPFIAEIQNLKDDNSYIAAKIGDGGWDLTTLVQENCIEKYQESKFEFQVGNWYKFTTKKGQYQFYVKVSDKNSHQIYFEGERYICNKRWDSGNSIDIAAIENPKLLTDLSEIQEFLPSDHIDKMKPKDKFEVGKWYIYSDSSMLGCYSGNDKAYGLKKRLTFWSDTLSMTDNNWKPATKEQVEDALLKYAKNTYPIGCIVNSLGGFQNEKVNSIEKGQNSIRFITYNNNRGILFNSTNGKWAEIVTIPEVKKDSMQEILEEAKRRFPIGCKYYPVYEDGGHSNTLCTQKQECYIYDENWIIGSCNVRNPQGIWAKLYEEPKKPKFEYKFKVGDKVKAINYGSGISYNEVENYPDRVYTITELGKYDYKLGYKVSPAVGNTLSGSYNGFIGEDTFELYKDEESIPVEWINTAQEIYKSKGEDALADYINYQTSEIIYNLLPGIGSKGKAELFVSEYCSIEPIKKYPLTPKESLESSIKLKKFEIKEL